MLNETSTASDERLAQASIPQENRLVPAFYIQPSTHARNPFLQLERPPNPQRCHTSGHGCTARKGTEHLEALFRAGTTLGVRRQALSHLFDLRPRLTM